MSGGSWEYVFHHFDDAANALESRHQPALRRALGKKIRLIAKAMHDIEWVDSSDMSAGDEIQAIKDALGEDAEALELSILISDAKEIINQINKTIAAAKKGGK